MMLVRILDACRIAVNSKDPSSVESLIDDNNLVEKSRSLINKITGEKPSDISVLEALLGLNFFVGKYKDENGEYELSFISLPVSVVKLSNGTTIKVFTPNGEVTDD